MFDIASYYEPMSLREALGFLSENPEARPIAGGTDLLIRLREGRLQNQSLMGLTRIPELSEIRLEDDGTVFLGSCSTFKRIETHPLTRKLLPLLSEAAAQVGGPQIRNMGTLGGNVVNGAVSADTPPALICYNAVALINDTDGERTCPVEKLYLGPGRTNLKPGELLKGFRIERESYEGGSGKYIKFAMREAMDIATLSMAALLFPSAEASHIRHARLCAGVAAPTPLRLTRTEEALQGCLPTQEVLDTAVKILLTEISPRSSWRASEDFRRQIAKELLCRAVREAWQRGGEK